MPRSTGINKNLCMDRFSDLGVEIHQRISVCSSGSSDPSAADFSPIAYLRDELLTKHPSLEGGVDETTRRSEAFKKLLASDARCQLINTNGFVSSEFTEGEIRGLQTTAKSLIGNLLYGWHHAWLRDCNFSNGASMGFKLQDAAPYKKFAERATVTPSCRPYALAAIKADPAWYSHMNEFHGDETTWFRLVPGNGLFTVPKNSKIDRAACKEPDMNMYLQKGIGGFIRRRLRTVGIDLNDQSVNQELARIGSIDGSLATIDLSSASDSISDRLVWELLPPDLYSFLSDIRSHRALMPDGTCHRWELFSTMGNGFTFELETLIFWALSKAVAINHGCSGRISVYGDDIIVPVEICSQVLALLSACGFIPNKDKTFTTGWFRESCGAHFFKGVDVKPFYIRKPVDNLRAVLHILNRIRGWGVVSGMSDPRLYEVWAWLSELVPTELRGGCDTERTDYLVTPDAPRMRLAERCELVTGFNKSTFSTLDHGGRFVAWLHRGHGEILQTRSSGRFRLSRNQEWFTECPLFPQECGARTCELA
jgi:hypothetical protein